MPVTSDTGTDEALHPTLAALGAAVDAVFADGGPEALGDPTSVVFLEQLLSRMEAATVRAVGAFDTGGAWADTGARGAAPWLTAACLLPKSLAAKQVRLARTLRSRPAIADAFSEGSIGGAQAELLVNLVRPSTEEAFLRDEALLVEQARSLRFDDLVRSTRYWSQMADPDGTEADAEVRREKRAVFLDQTLDGKWLGSMTLDPVSGAIVSSELVGSDRDESGEDRAPGYRAGNEPGNEPAAPGDPDPTGEGDGRDEDGGSAAGSRLRAIRHRVVAEGRTSEARTRRQTIRPATNRRRGAGPAVGRGGTEGRC